MAKVRFRIFHSPPTLPTTFVQEPFSPDVADAGVKVKPPVHNATSPIMRALVEVSTSLSPGFMKDAYILTSASCPATKSVGRDNLAVGSVDRRHFRGIASSGGGSVGAHRYIADSRRIVGSVRLPAEDKARAD